MVRELDERELKNSQLLTKAQIHRIYGVSSQTVTRLIGRGELTPVRVGTIDRVSVAEMRRFTKSRSATK